MCVARDPGTRLRDIAAEVGITERAVHRIVCDLEAEGYLTRTRDGSRNRYEVHPQLPLRRNLEQPCVGDVLELLMRADQAREESA